MTKIEWTDETWNPVVGCSKTSPGCDHCYAIGQAHRINAMQEKRPDLKVRGAYIPALTVKSDDGGVDWTGEVRCLPHKLTDPLRWAKPRRVFVNSMSDLFHPDVPWHFIVDVFATMARSDRHTFQILTKRPKRMRQILTSSGLEAHTRSALRVYGRGEVAWPLPNVWLGTSIESDRYTFRADHLCVAPAAVRFLSLEPLLGPLPSLDLTGIDWVIVGGESGPGARPMHPDWVRDIRDRCAEGVKCDRCDGWGHFNCGENGSVPLGAPRLDCNHCGGEGKIPVPFFFKQWGNWRPKWDNERDDIGDIRTVGDVRMVRERSKNWAGHDVLDGQQHHEYPTS